MPESEILSPTTYRQDSVFKDHSNSDKLKTAHRAVPRANKGMQGYRGVCWLEFTIIGRGDDYSHGIVPVKKKWPEYPSWATFSLKHALMALWGPIF
jgi:hypothetical protein